MDQIKYNFESLARTSGDYPRVIQLETKTGKHVNDRLVGGAYIPSVRGDVKKKNTFSHHVSGGSPINAWATKEVFTKLLPDCRKL